MTTIDRSPKQKFVDVALVLFSERGYYGVSLADVANEIGLTKQSVLHHFGTKETLYGEVLSQLSARFEAIVEETKAQPCGNDEKLALFLANLHAHMQSEPRDARLIARELLDNLDRAASSRKWYLKTFLDESVAILSERPEWRDRSLAEKSAAVWQMVGAVNYFAISGATLKGIWGAKRAREITKTFLPTLLQQTGQPK